MTYIRSVSAFFPSAAIVSTYAVGNDVGVTVEAALGVAVGLLVAGEVPDDERLVARTGQKHVRAVRRLASNCSKSPIFSPSVRNSLLEGGGQRRNPSGVALKGAPQHKLLGHLGVLLVGEDCRVRWLVSLREK